MSWSQTIQSRTSLSFSCRAPFQPWVIVRHPAGQSGRYTAQTSLQDRACLSARRCAVSPPGPAPPIAFQPRPHWLGSSHTTPELGRGAGPGHSCPLLSCIFCASNLSTQVTWDVSDRCYGLSLPLPGSASSFLFFTGITLQQRSCIHSRLHHSVCFPEDPPDT